MKRFRTLIHPGLRGALFYGIYWGVVGMFEPFITVHFIRLGFTKQQIGWLASVFPLFTFLITPIVSRLADRANRRILTLALACAGHGLMLIFLPWPTTFLAVLPIFALAMAFRSPVVSLADSLIARMAELRQLDFGSMRLWGSIVFTVTSLSMGWVWGQTGYPTMFVVSGAAFILVIAAAFLLDEPSGAAAPLESPPVDRTATRSLLLPEPGLLFLLAGNFLVVGAIFMGATFGTVYMDSLGASEFFFGALYGVSAMAEVPGMFFGQRLARRLGETNALLLGYALVAAGFAGYAVSVTPWIMLFFSAVRGLGFGLILVSTVTIINHRAPANLYATYQGLEKSLCWGLAPLLGGPMSGFLYQTYGPSTLFRVNAAMVIIAGLLLLPTYRLWKVRPTGTLLR